jgi:dTDP-glucose 4,6-dehydratase
MICGILDTMRPNIHGRSYKSQLVFVNDRPGHDFRYAIDPTKMLTEIGWRAVETFETGLTKTVSWYLANEDWWRPLQRERHNEEHLDFAFAKTQS